MTDLLNLSSSTLNINRDPIDLVHTHSATRSVTHGVRNGLNKDQNANLIQQSNNITQLSMQRIVQQNNINCVRDLNLILANISQLKTEITNKIINSIKSTRNNKIKDKSQEDTENNKSSDKAIDNTDSTEIIESYIILMLIRINAYLIDNQVLQSYKIVVFYQLLNNNPDQYKQMLSIIPYVTGNPLDGLSEIISHNTHGNNKKTSILTKLLNGGFEYTKDWLGLYVINDSLQQYVQQINVSYNNCIYRGFATNYNIDINIACQISRFNLHIPGFSEYW
jgi:hypothetical protein